MALVTHPLLHEGPWDHEPLLVRVAAVLGLLGAALRSVLLAWGLLLRLSHQVCFPEATRDVRTKRAQSCSSIVGELAVHERALYRRTWLLKAGLLEVVPLPSQVTQGHCLVSDAVGHASLLVGEHVLVRRCVTFLRLLGAA